MTNTKHKNVQVKFRAIAGGVIISLFLGGGFLIHKTLKSGSATPKKNAIQTVTLLKPPPLPELKEKPPEPEVKNEEKKPDFGDVSENQQEVADNNQDDTPAGDNLGLDAEGGAGSDGFGLVGKKGGRSLIGGSGGNGRAALLRKYAWYYQLVEGEIREKVNRILTKNGGLPSGNPKAVVEIFLGDGGEVVRWSLANASGDKKMDEALATVIKGMKVSEAPPNEMPKGMKLMVSCKG